MTLNDRNYSGMLNWTSIFHYMTVKASRKLKDSVQSPKGDLVYPLHQCAV